jgi:hypothetical protein
MKTLIISVLALEWLYAEAELRLKRRVLVLTIALIAVILSSFFAINEWFSNNQSAPGIFVGVECAYGNASDLKGLVDKVRNYTNLFVIGSLEVSFNQSALNESCDYIAHAGLNLIVLFTESQKYNYSIFVWMQEAKQKYGDRFLGVYRFDEPGGNQVDKGNPMLVKNATSYADAAATYTKDLGIIVNYYSDYAPKVFTSDYVLYWFDYEAGYNAVFAEFGRNIKRGQTRQLSIAVCRGAAMAHGKDWGAIVTWSYNDTPYIESGKELYDDMTLAYNAGAKYVVIFDYPRIEQYGILTEDHFNAIKEFWNYVHSNPQNFGNSGEKVAYVLPQDYGFGFRNPGDRIWGLWNADYLSQKVWDDANKLLGQYGTRLDIVYNDSESISAISGRYEKLFFWNETIE